MLPYLQPDQPALRWSIQSAPAAACFCDDRARCFAPLKDEPQRYVAQANEQFSAAEREQWECALHGRGLQAECYVAQAEERCPIEDGGQVERALHGRGLQIVVRLREMTTHPHEWPAPHVDLEEGWRHLVLDREHHMIGRWEMYRIADQ